MSAMCLVRRPDIFKVGVAGAPVIRWEDYDALYTERYMGMPESTISRSEAVVNADGYREASVLTHLENLRGRLFVIHGMRDENVLFRHTTALMEEASRLRKHIDLLILPLERHGIRDSGTQEYVEERLFRYVDEAMSHNPNSSQVQRSS